MSKSIQFILAASFVAGLAACSKPASEEYVVVDPEPISAEPVYTGKYK
ncbi:hypothetical protein PSM7751_03352 [Pseudooceanicola marinus]|uniref:Lipoprotein n=1 Tax=Pseudooceanicola marinus TaxID=396013 RepID=A0A1X6ZYL4_9RHOB|nr:hypothetical protein [Pseudooceanicola marinus]SLN65395.1 hypothetical protein PSM7751_03352 [Pseudooceanicola marinus]